MQLQTIQKKIYEIRGLKIMFDFDLAVFEVGFERNKSQPFFANFALQAGDFFFVQQQAARTGRAMVVNIAVAVRLDGHLQHFSLTVFDVGVGFVNADVSVTDGFDFSAAQFNTGFELLQDVKIPERFAVSGQHAGSIPGFFDFLGHV